MIVAAEFVGGPWDGQRRALGYDPNGKPPIGYTVRVEAAGPPTHPTPAYRAGEYRLRRSGDRSFMDWFPEAQP